MTNQYSTIRGHRRAVEVTGRVYLNGSRHDVTGRAFCHIAPETDDEEAPANAPWDNLPVDAFLVAEKQRGERLTEALFDDNGEDPGCYARGPNRSPYRPRGNGRHRPHQR